MDRSPPLWRRPPSRPYRRPARQHVPTRQRQLLWEPLGPVQRHRRRVPLSLLIPPAARAVLLPDLPGL